jgi:hypothetical protein
MLFWLLMLLMLQAKIKLYQGRFSLLYQRLRRNSRFAPLNAVQVGVQGALVALQQDGALRSNKPGLLLHKAPLSFCQQTHCYIQQSFTCGTLHSMR